MRLTLAHEGASYAYDVKKEITTVGRDPQCDVSLPSGTLSRFHAQFRREGDDLVVKDLGSRNGVYVNGARVSEARLRAGDEIRLGKLLLRYEAAASSEVPAAFSPAAPPVPSAPPPGANEPTPVDLSFSPQDLKAAAPVPVPPRPRRAPAQEGLLLWLGRRWKWAVAGFIAFDLLVIAGFMALKEGKKKEAPPEPPRSKEDATLLEEAAVRMEQARDLLRKDPDGARRLWKQARADLEGLRGKGYDGIVSRLAAVVDRWEPVTPDYANFDWDSYRRVVDFLDDIEHERKCPPRVQEIARAWSDWLKREAVAREKLLKIAPLAAPEAGLARWQEAHTALLAADRKSIAWPAFEGKLPELEGRIREAYLAQAQKAFAQGQWDAAVSALESAGRWGEGNGDGLREAIEREKAAVASLLAARQALAEGRPDEARRLVEAVPAGSRFEGEAQAMRAALARGEAREEVLSLFNRGKGPEAVERLIEGPYEDDVLSQLIRKVDAALAEAVAAEGKLDFDQAILKSGEVLAALPGEEYAANEYRLRAEAMRQAWEAPARRAKRFYEEGKAREAAGDVREAYAWWRRAQKEDPEGKWGDEEARAYRARSLSRRNEAMRMASMGDKAGARKAAAEALALAEPGSYEERKAREILEGLPE